MTLDSYERLLQFSLKHVVCKIPHSQKALLQLAKATRSPCAMCLYVTPPVPLCSTTLQFRPNPPGHAHGAPGAS